MNVKKQNSGIVILAGDAIGGEFVSMGESHFLVTQFQDDNGNVALADIEDGYLEYVSPETELTIIKHVLVVDPTEATKNFLELDQFDKKPKWTSVPDLVDTPVVSEKEIKLESEEADPEKDSDVLNITLATSKKKKKKNKNKNKDFQTI